MVSGAVEQFVRQAVAQARADMRKGLLDLLAHDWSCGSRLVDSDYSENETCTCYVQQVEAALTVYLARFEWARGRGSET